MSLLIPLFHNDGRQTRKLVRTYMYCVDMYILGND